MSVEGNVAMVRAAYAAFSAGDAAGAMKDMADDVEWIVPGDSAVSGTYRGKEEVAGFFAKLAEKSFTTSPQRFLGDGDIVVVLTEATLGGETADQVDVHTIHDGKTVKFQAVVDTAIQERVFGPK